jgi:hypothetical protein
MTVAIDFDASLGSRQRAAPGPDSHCGRDSSDLPSRTLARRWLTTKDSLDGCGVDHEDDRR